MAKGAKKRIRPTPVRAAARAAKRRIRPTPIRMNKPGEAAILLGKNLRELDRIMRGSGCYRVRAHERCNPAKGSSSRASKSTRKSTKKAPAKKTPAKKKKSKAEELKEFEAEIKESMAKSGRKRGEALGSKFLDDLERRYAEIEGVKLPSKSSTPSPSPPAASSSGPVRNIQSLVRKKKK
jgi:hypothetical protein